MELAFNHRIHKMCRIHLLEDLVLSSQKINFEVSRLCLWIKHWPKYCSIYWVTGSGLCSNQISLKRGQFRFRWDLGYKRGISHKEWAEIPLNSSHVQAKPESLPSNLWQSSTHFKLKYWMQKSRHSASISASVTYVVSCLKGRLSFSVEHASDWQ